MLIWIIQKCRNKVTNVKCSINSYFQETNYYSLLVYKVKDNILSTENNSQNFCMRIQNYNGAHKCLGIAILPYIIRNLFVVLVFTSTSKSKLYTVIQVYWLPRRSNNLFDMNLIFMFFRIFIAYLVHINYIHFVELLKNTTKLTN